MRCSMVRFLSRLHASLFRATRGVIGRRLVNNNMLLLTTRGRCSNRRHTVPLLYLEGSDGLLILVASYGGRSRHPDWYLNLGADAAAEIQIRGKRFAVLASTASPTERAEWWPQVVTAFAGYADYQARTSRKIPIVLLRPA